MITRKERQLGLRQILRQNMSRQTTDPPNFKLGGRAGMGRKALDQTSLDWSGTPSYDVCGRSSRVGKFPLIFETIHKVIMELSPH